MVNSWTITPCTHDAYMMKHELFKMGDKALNNQASAHGPNLNSHPVLS